MDDGKTHMTCVLKVNTHRSGWDRSLYRLLKGIGDVSYTVDATKGMAYVSGKICPEVILKIRKAKKHTQLIHLEYGYKNPNYPPENPPADGSICSYCAPPANIVQNPYEPAPPPPQSYYYHQPPPHYSYPYSTSPYSYPYPTGEPQCRIM